MALLKNSDFIDPNFFLDFIAEAKKAEETLNALEKALNNVLDVSARIAEMTPLDNFANIQSLSKALATYAEAEQKLFKVQAEKLKLEMQIEKARAQALKSEQEAIKLAIQQEKLTQQQIKSEKQARQEKEKATKATKESTEATDEELKAKIKERLEAKERAAQLKDLVIIEKSEATSLEYLAAKIRMLQRERAKLDLSTQEGQDRVAAINKEIDDNNALITENLDKQSKQTRNVGNYTESINKAIESNEAFNRVLASLNEATGGLIDRLASLTEGTEDSEEAAESAGKGWKKLNTILKASIIGTIVAAVGAITKSFTDSREGSIWFEVKLQQLSKTVTTLGSALWKWIGGVGAWFKKFHLQGELMRVTFSNLGSILRGKTVPELEALKQKINENEKAIDEGMDAFDNFGDTVAEVADDIKTLREQQEYLNDEMAVIGVEIAKLAGEEEALQLTAEDTTKSYEEQTEAQKAALKVIEQRVKLEQQLAEKQLDLAVLAVKIDLKTQKAAKGVTDAEIRSLAILKNKDLQLKISAEAAQGLGEAVARVQELKNASTIATMEGEKTLHEIARDQWERELDFTLEIADAVKTVNEVRIAENKISLEEQAKTIKETRQLMDASFANQIKQAEEFTGKRLELEKLVKIDDEEVIRKKLKIAKFDDIVAGRLLEIIRERKLAVQDLEDLDNAVAERIRARDARALKAANDLAETEREIEITKAAERSAAADKALEDQDKFNELVLIKAKAAAATLLELQIADELTKRDVLLDNAQLIEDERRKIIAESEEKIRLLKADAAAKTADQTEKLNKKSLEDEAELLQKGAEVLDAFVKAQFDKRLELIDRNIQASADRQKQLEEAASKGVESVTENLAFEEKKQAELQAQRAAEVERQKKIELGLTALKVYASKIAAGDKNALGSTITDVSLLTAFVQSLPAAWEGTNDKTVGEVFGAPHMPGRDGYIVRVDKSETILDPERTKAYHAQLRADNVPRGTLSAEGPKVVKKLECIEQAILNQPVYLGRDYSATEKAIIDTIECRHKIIRNHAKRGGLFS